MTTTPVYRDERTVAVENASARWGYTVLIFGLLLDVIYRGFLKSGTVTAGASLVQANGDLIGLVCFSSLITTVHQVRHGLWRTWLEPPLRRRLLLVTVLVLGLQVLAAWAILRFLL
ncbi:MAG: hypothetical protein WDA75_07540 [Candidatus Latescibacterota bacterium]|jgi:hypothetical protein